MAILISPNRSREPRGKGHLFAAIPRRAVVALAGWCLLLGLGLNVVHGQPVSREYPLKAVFLLNFAQFTDWPATVVANTNAPFVIGVLGHDPFGRVLDDAVQGENWNGHPIAIRRYQQLIDLRDCQVLFISESEERSMPKIMGELRGKPVLTVSDLNNPAAENVSIQFVTRNNHIRFRINTDTLKNAGLTMSSKLLRVAEIAPPGK